jgi:hypothetical protein
MRKTPVTMDEDTQRLIEDRALELFKAKLKEYRQEFRQNFVREECQDEIRAWAEQLAEIKVAKLQEENERSVYIIDRQARELEKLTANSEVLREVLASGGGIKELVRKLEEMKRKILQLEAMLADAKSTQFPDLSQKSPSNVLRL